MRAKDFYKEYANTLRPPTARKIINLARKLNLKDNVSEIICFTGLSEKQASEFSITGLA